MLETNKTVVRRYIEEMLNQRNLALVEELFTGDSVLSVLQMPELRGLEARRQFTATLFTAFPDGHYIIEDLIAEGDKVVARWTWTGTHQGELMGIAATGKHLSLRGTTTLRVFGGKIIEEYGDWDALAYLQQVGAIPQSTEANKVLARRYIEDFLNNRDWAVADEILAEDYVGRGPHMPDICGPKAMKQFHIGLQASFPDRHFTVVQLIAEVDKVVVRWESVGTRTGEWMGVAPTGKSVRWSGVDTLRIAGGKVVEEWAEIDFLGFFQQVGIAPLVGEIKSPPTGQPDQKDIGRESAFQAAKAAFSLYGGFFKDVSQEIGMEKAESLHTKQGEFFGAKLAEITKKRLADKDFDMKTFASVLSDSYQIFGFTYGIEESAASLRLSCSRCPVYEGFKSAGLDHATVELLCNRMAAVELDEEKKLCPILSASLKFRATPDEACVEKFALAK